MATGEGENRSRKGLFNILFKLAVAAASVYLVVSFIGGQLRLAEKQRQLDELEARVAVWEETNEEMQRLMEGDDEAAYIERMAREKLGYARPDEWVFIDLTGE